FGVPVGDEDVGPAGLARDRDGQAGQLERLPRRVGRQARPLFLGQVDGAHLGGGDLVERGEVVLRPHGVGLGQPVQHGGLFGGGAGRRGAGRRGQARHGGQRDGGG